MRRPNHASRFEGIAKTKLQASRASDTETLQSQVNKAAKKRLSLSGLEVLHGRLFIAVSTPAEANHHGVPWTFRLGSTREQRISGGQEFKITETGVSRACRARIFHVRWVDASGKGYALPEIFLRNFPVPIRCSRSILTRPRVLSLIAPVANISFIGVQ
jgi:hypothetical protein